MTTIVLSVIILIVFTIMVLLGLMFTIEAWEQGDIEARDREERRKYNAERNS